MFGLKTAPKAWQQDFAETMHDMGPKRLRSVPEVCYFPTTLFYDMSFVGDILTIGPQDSADCFYEELSKTLLIKHLGELRTSGRDIAFAGRLLHRDHDGVHLLAPKAYVEMVNLLGFERGKPDNTPGTSPPTRKDNDTSAISPEDDRCFIVVCSESFCGW